MRHCLPKEEGECIQRFEEINDVQRINLRFVCSITACTLGSKSSTTQSSKQQGESKLSWIPHNQLSINNLRQNNIREKRRCKYTNKNILTCSCFATSNSEHKYYLIDNMTRMFLLFYLVKRVGG